MDIVQRSPFVFVPIVSRFRPPGLHATLIVKGTFRLVPDGQVVLADVQQQLSGDVYEDDDTERDCLYESDAAFWKPRADALVLAARGTRPGRPLPQSQMTFAVGNHFRRSLPNLEDLERTSREKRDGEESVGFGPISRLSKTRMELAGTYDEAWLKKRWPWFPKDFDWTYFNAAPRAQQIEGYLRGDEVLRFENLHAAYPVLRTRLPGVRVRVLLSPSPGADPVDAAMNLDTLFVDIDQLVVILVWRGVVPVETETLNEYSHVLVASERLADPPTPSSDYREMLASLAATGSVEQEFADRVDAFVVPSDGSSDHDAAGQESADTSRLEAEIVRLEAEMADALKKQGIQTPSPPAKPPTMEEIRKQLSGLPAALAASGMQLPPPVQQEVLELAKGEWLSSLEAELAELESHPASEPRWTRESCQAHAAQGGRFVAEDLSGLDLAGAKLANADLSQAILTGANLAGADLSRSNLTGALLNGAELGGAVLRGAILRQADLTAARAKGADFSRGEMQDMDASEAIFDGATWKGVDATRAVLYGASFKDADLSGSILTEADLGRAALERASFTSSDLSRASFEHAMGGDAALTDANLTGLKAQEADFTRGRFERVNGGGSLWDRAKLEGSDFSSARLPRASFSQAALSEARLVGVEMPHASFEGATLTRAHLRNSNLFRGSLEGADLEGADLRGANLYEVEFLGARTDRARLDGANLKSTKLAALQK